MKSLNKTENAIQNIINVVLTSIGIIIILIKILQTKG